MPLRPQIPASRLRDPDVRAEFECWRKADKGHEPDRVAEFNQALTIAFRRDLAAESVLYGGVGVGSPSYDTALAGTVLTHPDWVMKDYPTFCLLGASYWSDSGLERTGAIWALNHAFGGDTPQRWENAQRGVILFRSLSLHRTTTRPSDADLLDSTKAWKFPGGRGEYLVFTEIANCDRLSPFDFARAAATNDVDAEVLLCTAYLYYLRFEKGNGINPASAKALLNEYR